MIFKFHRYVEHIFVCYIRWVVTQWGQIVSSSLSIVSLAEKGSDNCNYVFYVVSVYLCWNHCCETHCSIFTVSWVVSISLFLTGSVFIVYKYFCFLGTILNSSLEVKFVSHCCCFLYSCVKWWISFGWFFC